MSVYNSNQKLLEASQDTSVPVVHRGSYVWWACVWNMVTPLENIEPGCYVVIELRDHQVDPTVVVQVEEKKVGAFSSLFGGGKSSSEPVANATQSQLIAWHIMPIDLEKIDSTHKTLEFFQGSVMYPPKAGDPPPASTTTPLSDFSFLETDILISQRSKEIYIKEFVAQPKWVNLYLAHTGLKHIESDVKSGASKTVDSNTYFDIVKFLGVPPPEVKVDPRAASLSEADISAMSIKELKSHLEFYGVDFSMLLEKNDFREALKIEKSNRKLLK